VSSSSVSHASNCIACIIVSDRRTDHAAGSTNFQNESQGVEPENLRRVNESALREFGRLNAALAQPQSFVPAELPVRQQSV
jgi:hypothetical protein